MSAPKINRKLHRLGAIATALPLLLVIASGILLQLKKESDWIQPPTAHGSSKVPRASLEALLAAAKSADKGISSWDDVDRLDFRPSKGVVKVRGRNRWEVQIDAATAEVLQVAYRRSDLIESLHDGSYLHKSAKLWLFLPCALVLLGLWVSGLYLWWLPHRARRRKRRRRS